MKKYTLIFATLMAGLLSCGHKASADDSAGAFPPEYQTVLDSIRNSADKEGYHAGYFMYDITGDGVPELWIKMGSCEADTRLTAYTAAKGKARKIYDGEGGHSEFFIYDGELVGVMCSTGAGAVVTYRYNGKKVKNSVVSFSTWNENGEALSEPHDAKADAKLKYWQDNYDKYIQPTPLKP